MKKGNFFKEVFKDSKTKYSAIGVVAMLIVLAIAYAFNPTAFANIFGYSGVGMQGDYVVKQGKSIPVYTQLQDLKDVTSGISTKAPTRTMVANELFGLDTVVEDAYARIVFYDSDMEKGWVGFITKTQLDNDSIAIDLPDYFRVSFISDGVEVSSQMVQEGQKATMPSYVKKGYKLDGWYTSKYSSISNRSLDTKWDFNTPITSDLTLTARWVTVDGGITVYFNAEGGTPTPTIQHVLSGSKISRPVTVTRTGCTFKYWKATEISALDPKRSLPINKETGEWNFDWVVYGKPLMNNRIVLQAQWACNTAVAIARVDGNPTAWTHDDVTLTVVPSDKTSKTGLQYSFDNGATWQTSPSKVFKSNATVNIKIKNNTATTAAYPVVINRIDKTAPVVTLTPDGRGSAAYPVCATDNRVTTTVSTAVNYSISGKKSYARQITQNDGTWSSPDAATSTTFEAVGIRYIKVTACNNANLCTTKTSAAYFLDGPIISVRYNKSIPTSSSITATYTCSTGVGNVTGCDSKFSTATGSPYEYSLKTNNSKSITLQTTVSNGSYKYLWVKAVGSKCSTSNYGVRIDRVFT